MKIFLTGSTGFVGRNILEKLREDYYIDAPDRHTLNLLDPETVYKHIKKHEYDIVIHAANPSPLRSGDPPDQMLSSMLTQFFGILRAKEYFGRFIYFGSGAEYDKTRDICSVREEEIGKRLPQSQYGLAKYVMNEYAREAKDIYNLRLFGCFGPYEFWPTCFISNAICRSLFDMPITIRQNVYFDYLYVNDVVDVVKWFLKSKPEQKDFNICSVKRTDLVSLANLVRDISGKKSKILIANEGFNKEYTADNMRLKTAFSDFQVTPLKNAIDTLYRWYKERVNTIDPSKIQT